MRLVIVIGLAQALAGCSDATRVLPQSPTAIPSPTPPSPPSGRLQGLVLDSVFRPLAGTTIEVLDGPHAGASGMTTDEGLFGIAADVSVGTRVRASKDGYVSGVGAIDESTHGGWVSFRLAPIGPNVEIAGDYAVTFVASKECGLPPPLARRTYAGTITPAPDSGYPYWVFAPNATYSFDLAGAQVVNRGLGAVGVAGDLVVFALNTNGTPYIVEQLASGERLGITGSARAVVGGTGVSTLSMPLEGSVDHPSIGNCRSDHHQLILTRR
jgi:hypothetical protein